MTTTELIHAALATVQDPELHRALPELGMVKSVEVKGTTAQLEILLTISGCPMKDRLQKDIDSAVLAVEGISAVEITFGVMDEEQRANIKKLLRNGRESFISFAQKDSLTRVIGVASGKGGVGKSTVTANLAVSLAKMGFSVGILDADIYGPSMPIMFDVENEKPVSVMVDGKSKMKPIESYEVKILSIGFFTSPSQAVIWRGPMASKALNQMIFDADWGELDFMLIDLPPGTGDVHLSIVQSLPITGVVIVSTPQAVALADAKKGVSMFMSEAINVPVLGIIENMAYFTPEGSSESEQAKQLPENKYYIFGKEGARNLAEDLEVPFLGEVPIVQSIREAGDYGRPAAMQTGSIIETVFEEITRNVVREVVSRNESLPATEAIKITTMAGCSAVKK